MKYLPQDAQCVFVDGPVAVYVHVSSEKEVLEAYTRLGKLIALAAKNLHDPEINKQPLPKKRLTPRAALATVKP